MGTNHMPPSGGGMLPKFIGTLTKINLVQGIVSDQIEKTGLHTIADYDCEHAIPFRDRCEFCELFHALNEAGQLDMQSAYVELTIERTFVEREMHREVMRRLALEGSA